MTDIVERLRWDMRYTNGHVPVTLSNAADEIVRLRDLASALMALLDQLPVKHPRQSEFKRELRTRFDRVIDGKRI